MSVDRSLEAQFNEIKSLREQLAQAQQAARPVLDAMPTIPDPQPDLDAIALALRRAGAGGTSGGVTDDWKAGVDRQLAQLHGDVRNLLYGLVGTFLLLGGMIGGLYLRTDAKFDTLRAETASIRTEQAKTGAELGAKLDILVEREHRDLPAPGAGPRP